MSTNKTLKQKIDDQHEMLQNVFLLLMGHTLNLQSMKPYIKSMKLIVQDNQGDARSVLHLGHAEESCFHKMLHLDVISYNPEKPTWQTEFFHSASVQNEYLPIDLFETEESLFQLSCTTSEEDILANYTMSVLREYASPNLSFWPKNMKKFMDTHPDIMLELQEILKESLSATKSSE